MNNTLSIEQQRKSVESLPSDQLDELKRRWLAYISEPVRLYHEPRMSARLPTMFIIWAHAVLIEREEIPSF